MAGQDRAWPGLSRIKSVQQGWFVPHDVLGLVELMGRAHFTAELVALFDNTPSDFLWNDYYNHANEPVHQVPFLFNEIGMPWLT